MKKKLSTLFFVLSAAITVAQTKHVINYHDGKKHIEYHTKNGMLNGTYISYYETGQKKAEGNYTDNQRTGIWSVWDAKGIKRAERFFTNSIEFKITSAFDSSGANRNIKTFNTLKYSTVDPALGYVPYYPIKEEDVAWEKRLWRSIDNDSAVNKPLFDQNHFYSLLVKAIKNKEIEIYADEEFQCLLTYDSIKKYENISINSFLIKEDLFYNKPLNVAEYRTIGICPAIKKSGKTKQLFWIYYPGCRSFLAKSNIMPALSNSIANYELLFFKRYFYSIIYKEGNLYNREIGDYTNKRGKIREAERIEMTSIDYEFGLWYSLIIFRDK